MDEHLVISTPEQVAFQYEMAGIGSRFVASLLDHLILLAVLVLINCAAFAIGVGSLTAGAQGETTAYLVLAILTLIFFLIFWGYFAVFEMAWNGQTPGKRAGRLRVIRRDGQPVGAGEVMIRNLVRLVDFLPGFYGIGLITMFIDKEARRLGDFAAGTIVIREGEQTRLRDVRVPEQAQAVSAATASYQASSAYTSPYTGQGSQPSPQPARFDPLPGVSLREVTPDDYRLIRELLERVKRGELARERGEELAARMAYGVAARMGHDFAGWQRRGWRPMVFLESVLAAGEARGV